MRDPSTNNLPSFSDPRDLRIAELEAENRRLAEQVKVQAELINQLEEKIKRLEQLLASQATGKSSRAPIFTEDYSLTRNLESKLVTKKKKSPGRKPKAAKDHLATRTISIFPKNISSEQCVHRRFQYAWRIIEGKAVYVCYDIQAPADAKELPLPFGLRNARSEYGIEVILILSYLHYWVGVSLDKSIEVMNFFLDLKLSKSQADSLLSQLASDWDEQYDAIAELIALQTIVYIDETGWKVGKKSNYTWVFSTPLHVLFRCGVSRKQDEATEILGNFFSGIGVTDDYAAYQSLFDQHQLCWAHLLRKAIKLALQYPDSTEYLSFYDELCGMYRDAKKLRKQGLAATASQEALPYDAACEIEKLQEQLKALCTRRNEKIITPAKSSESQPATETATATFIRLQRELCDNLDCLFVFIEHPAVEPTNNRSERNVRREAEIRKGSRTSKTAAGAKRRSTIMTVLASLQTRISDFTLDAFLSEVQDWIATGKSIFQTELQMARAAKPPPD